MCERLLLAFMWVAAVVRVLVPCSISCSTYMENRFLYLSLHLHLLMRVFFSLQRLNLCWGFAVCCSATCWLGSAGSSGLSKVA